MKLIPYALYELNDDGEASGIVHFYCCYSHAEADLETGGTYDDIRTAGGDDNDAPDGTVCERCGVSLRHFYRTTYTYTVLSEDPMPGSISLAQIAEMTDDGDCVGHFGETKTETLTAKEIVAALYNAGSEPGFFMLDDDGKEV